MKPAALGRGVRPGGHVVVITTSFPAHPGDPSGHFVASEVRALEQRGHVVTVIAPRPATGAADRPGVTWIDAGSAFGWPGAISRLHERPWRALSALAFVVRARRALLREGDVERVIAHHAIPSAWPIAAVLTARKTPLEVVVHGSDARLIARLAPFLRRRIARALGSADVRAVSAELRELLGRALGPEIGERVRVEPAVIDVSGVPKRLEARRELGIPESERLIVVVGRLVRQKRVDVALAAASLVERDRVVVVGDGPERRALERTFPDVTFAGLLPRDRALAWISAADALVSASREEGAPSVVREARALGTKVVACSAGDLAVLAAADDGIWLVEGI